uniref:Peptidase M13 N-terminal domain-containing protein n=1 Tax=Tetranychus urticae TaxID=32264 RepID=T1JUD6_TETUR
MADIKSTNSSTMSRNPPWWNRRTRMERGLCTIAIVSLVMCLFLTIALAFVAYQYNANLVNGLGVSATADKLIGAEDHHIYNSLEESQSQQTVCLTKGCVSAAADIIRNVDNSVDPCDDFYKFACGGWLDRHTIPEDRTSVSVFSAIQDDLNNKLRVLVESEAEPNEPRFYTMLRSMYKSCMNLTEIERVGNEPVLETLNELGGWPVLEQDKWNASSFNWLDSLIKFRKAGFSHDILMDLSVNTDYRNNTRHVIDLDQATLGMPDRSYLLRGLNDSAVQGYYKLMVESAVMLGADRQKAEKDMLEALAFETILANFSIPREERRNISLLYNLMTVKEIETIAPNVNWSRFFNYLLNDPIPPNELVLVNVPTYLKKLDKLLVETDGRIVANYMMWRIVLQCYTTLGKRWRELAQEYNKVITGQDREEPRWEQCMSSLTGSLGVALSSLYVKNHFKEGSKYMALEMVNYIHKEFLTILDEVDWMDANTTQRAREKANAIVSYIGYPDELLNNSKVGELYTNVLEQIYLLKLAVGILETLAESNILIDKRSYFTNVQNLRKWSTDFAFNKLRKPNLKGEWTKHARAAVVNAYYNALENSIEFPAGILQGSFFSKDRPNYLNFGAIGFVIGHEITHGFDDRGRQFDKDGNNKNWWDHVTDQKFRSRTQCIIDQYGNYTLPENGMKVNGINTQGENIADNGGLKEAFRAYQKWVFDHGKEPTLPGLSYSTDQLFWISAANVWCGKYRPEVLRLRVSLGSHSPSRFRVIGPMSNIEEFSKSFKCPRGTPMNPQKKCHVW